MNQSLGSSSIENITKWLCSTRKSPHTTIFKTITKCWLVLPPTTLLTKKLSWKACTNFVSFVLWRQSKSSVIPCKKSLLNVLKNHWKTRQNPRGLLLHLCHAVLAPESSKIRQSDGSKNTRRKTKKSLKLHQKFVKMLWLQQTTWMMVKRLPYSNPKPFVIEKNSGNRWTSVAII